MLSTSRSLNPALSYCFENVLRTLSDSSISLSQLTTILPNVEGRYPTSSINQIFKNCPWFASMEPVIKVMLQEDSNYCCSPNSSDFSLRFCGAILSLYSLYRLTVSPKLSDPIFLASSLSKEYASTIYYSYGGSSTCLSEQLYQDSLSYCLCFHIRSGMSLTSVATVPPVSDLFLLLQNILPPDSVILPAALDHVRTLFTGLADSSGIIPKSSFMTFGGGCISTVLLSSTLLYSSSPDSGINWEDFLNFCLGINFCGSDGGIRYLFKRLDFEVKGYFTYNDVKSLIFDLGKQSHSSPIVLEGLVAEVFDTCLKELTETITLHDLLKLPYSVANQIMSILFDASTHG
ncbi:hypothetical protein GEMRC1_003277 [Eukaryota sp. GEM-RC1]